MLGMSNGFTPKFVKKFADLYGQIVTAVTEYKEKFSKELFQMKNIVLKWNKRFRKIILNKTRGGHF